MRTLKNTKDGQICHNLSHIYVSRSIPILTGAIRDIHPWNNYLMNAYYGKHYTRHLGCTFPLKPGIPKPSSCTLRTRLGRWEQQEREAHASDTNRIDNSLKQNTTLFRPLLFWRFLPFTDKCNILLRIRPQSLSYEVSEWRFKNPAVCIVQYSKSRNSAICQDYDKLMH